MHKISVHEKIKFNCNFCEKSFTSANLKNHIKTLHDGHGNRFDCDACDKKFAHSQSLKNHKMIAHNETTIESNNKLDQDVANRNNSAKDETVEKETEQDESDELRDLKTKIMKEVVKNEPMQDIKAVDTNDIEDRNEHEGTKPPAVEEFSFTPEQVDHLEGFFRIKQHINIFEIEQLATTGTYPNYAKVQQWFAKRREEIGNVKIETLNNC